MASRFRIHNFVSTSHAYGVVVNGLPHLRRNRHPLTNVAPGLPVPPHDPVRNLREQREKKKNAGLNMIRSRLTKT
jgi:hypothetical protein